MKSIFASVLFLLSLARCTDPGTEGVATNLLVGNWKNADTGFIVNFDENENYNVQFGANDTFSSKYKLSLQRGSKPTLHL